MKVLMLGWEFPPHISGGLGTACFGLTQGLAANGVETLFVVPRAYGDEDARHLSLIGANQVPVHERVRTRELVREGRAEQLVHEAGQLAQAPDTADFAELAAEAGDPRLAELVKLIAVDSPLRPYLGEGDYLQRLEALAAQGSEEAAAAIASVAAAADGLAPAGAVQALLEQRLARFPEVAELVRESSVARTYAFHGNYGPDLLSEVARFAVVVGELARRGGFDVIHAHDWMTYPAGIVAKAVSGKPLVLHMHACEYDRSGENVNPRIRDLEQMGFDAADRIACVSHYTANMIRRWYRVDRARLRVVHNAVTHREAAQRVHAEKVIEEPIVLFLGRITFQKGPDYFIDAAARVVEIEPRVKFVMSGSGDMLPRMIERAARKGLARHMHFTGFLKGRDVERMYAMADIYVMPSVSEPFGISPLEAMALDTPVVVSRQSGVAEVLANALKVDFWDVDGMANQILALLRYPALSEQLIEDGKEEVRRLRWERQGALMKEVYGELVG